MIELQCTQNCNAVLQIISVTSCLDQEIEMNWYTVLIQSSAQGPHFLEVHCTCAPHTCVPYGAYLKQSTY